VVSLNFEQPHRTRAIDDVMFREVVRGTFGKRRKTMRNGLRALNVPSFFFEKPSMDFSRRPEELSVEDFVNLSNELSQLTIDPTTNRPEAVT
jgi:Dimethyladenosine transferase (rRNA methylation)